MVYITSGSTCLQLPDAAGFAIVPKRFSASRRANAGNIIRQTSSYHVSSAEAVYSGLVSEAQATSLSALHVASSSVLLTVRDHVYNASMSLDKCQPSPLSERWEVSITFGIVDELVF